MVCRLALRLVEHPQTLTVEINELTAAITERITTVAPALLAIVGCGLLTAAKIVGETAQVSRFHSKGAFARLNDTAPLPVWSSNKQRHRLSRTGNRQLNAALHRIAMAQARMHPPARELLARRKLNGDGTMEAPRVLKRRLSEVVYRAMLTDQNQSMPRRLTEELETDTTVVDQRPPPPARLTPIKRKPPRQPSRGGFHLPLDNKCLHISCRAARRCRGER